MVDSKAQKTVLRIQQNLNGSSYDHPRFVLYETANSFTITPCSPVCVQKSLTIDKQSLKASQHQLFTPQSDKCLKTIQIYGVVGLLNIYQTYHLVVIKSCSEVARIKSSLKSEELNPQIVFELGEIDFIAVQQSVSEQLKEQIVPILQKINKYLSHGFYFAHNFRLTLNAQKQSQTQDQVDYRYMWNYNLCKDFYIQKIPSYWCVPLIQGYVEQTAFSNDVQMLLIARRRWRMGGCRYKARGVDEQGNASNFTELEQLIFQHSWCQNKPQVDSMGISQRIISKTKVYSHVQIRGSMPFIWEQSGLATIQVSKAKESAKAFKQHFVDVLKDYQYRGEGKILCLNLVGTSKSMEKQLLDQYEQLIESSAFPEEVFAYKHFSFHHECRENSEPMMDVIESEMFPNLIGAMGIFVQKNEVLQLKQDYSTKERVISTVLQVQTGVVRTNCVDCLDRTNVAQQMISLKCLQEFVPELQGLEWLEPHIYTWAMAGDNVSKMYSGTDSVLTKITLKGHQNAYDKVQQKLLSVKRWTKQTWTDDFKHDCILILQGLHPSCQRKTQVDYVKKNMETRANLEAEKNQILVQVVSINAAGKLPPDYRTILPLFQNCRANTRPEIVVVGIQEMIKSTLKSMVGNFFSSKSQDYCEQWKYLVGESLNSINKLLNVTARDEEYAFFQGKDMAGCFIMLFAKKKVLTRVKDIYLCQVKAGMGGFAKNKGSVALRFKFDETSFAFLNCHLESGEGRIIERTDMMQLILDEAFKKAHGLAKVMDHNMVVVLGDLNFRVDLTSARCRKAVADKDIEYVKQFDELTCLRNRNGLHETGQYTRLTKRLQDIIRSETVLDQFKEGDITFMPTYKFDKGTHNYDSSRKNRVPSWCDRILFKASNPLQEVKLLEYQSCHGIAFSDHKPIYATFQLYTRSFKNKQQTQQQLQQEYFNMQRFKSIRVDKLDTDWLSLKPQTVQRQLDSQYLRTHFDPKEIKKDARKAQSINYNSSQTMKPKRREDKKVEISVNVNRKHQKQNIVLATPPKSTMEKIESAVSISEENIDDDECVEECSSNAKAKPNSITEGGATKRKPILK